MTIEDTKQFISGGQWQSIAPEIRPSSVKNADGSLKPFYLTRKFTYHLGDKFELEIINLVDPYGKVPLAKLLIKGHVQWKSEHPIAAGAYKVDFVADEGYEVTPLLQGFADVLNQLASQSQATNGRDQRNSKYFEKTVCPLRPRGRTSLFRIRLDLYSQQYDVLGS